MKTNRNIHLLPNSEYIDENCTISRTPENVLNYAKCLLGEAEQIRNKSGLDEADKYYKTTSDYLKQAIVFGQNIAAFFLAYLYDNGYGVMQNTDRAVLFAAIGEKLSDPNCINLMKGEVPIWPLNMPNFLSKPRNLTFEELKTVQKYVKFIKKNIVSYKADKQIDILTTFKVYSEFESIDYENGIGIYVPDRLESPKKKLLSKESDEFIVINHEPGFVQKIEDNESSTIIGAEKAILESCVIF